MWQRISYRGRYEVVTLALPNPKVKTDWVFVAVAHAPSWNYSPTLTSASIMTILSFFPPSRSCLSDMDISSVLRHGEDVVDHLHLRSLLTFRRATLKTLIFRRCEGLTESKIKELSSIGPCIDWDWFGRTNRLEQLSKQSEKDWKRMRMKLLIVKILVLCLAGGILIASLPHRPRGRKIAVPSITSNSPG